MWSLECSSGDKIQADHQSSRETMTRSSQAGTQSHVSGEALSRVTCRPTQHQPQIFGHWLMLLREKTRKTNNIHIFRAYSHGPHFTAGRRRGGSCVGAGVRWRPGGKVTRDRRRTLSPHHDTRLGLPSNICGGRTGGLGRTRQSRGPLYPRYICPSVSPPRPHPAAVFDWFSYIHYKPQVCNVGMAGAGAGAVAGCGGGNVEI